jgi:hypothetical protein
LNVWDVFRPGVKDETAGGVLEGCCHCRGFSNGGKALIGLNTEYNPGSVWSSLGLGRTEMVDGIILGEVFGRVEFELLESAVSVVFDINFVSKLVLNAS